MAGPRVNPWIEAIDIYVPGKGKVEGVNRVYKLSANETPLGPSPKAVAAFEKAAATLHRYPEGSCPELRAALGKHHDIDPARIICGDGSDEVLSLIAQAFAGPGDEVLYVRHGFMVYPIVARRVGAIPVAAPDRDYTADVDALLAAVTDRTKIVFLANPNNPTGTLLNDAEVRRLHRGLPEDVLLVLDEAYIEYIDRPDYEGGLPMVEDAENIVVTRTFSKIYGLAAARIGWGYSTPKIIEALHKARPPFNVTEPTQQAAVAALADQDWVAKAKAHNDEWLPWLHREIAALGLYPVPSDANFILIKFPEADGVTAEAANRYLVSHGYILRWLPGQGLPDCLRLTVGLEEENRAVIEHLRGFLAQYQDLEQHKRTP